jgi:hypothetical protein
VSLCDGPGRAMVDKSSEEWRAQCEARYWLKGLGRSKDKFDVLIARIRKVRGQAASDKLAENIRKEWTINAKRKKKPST